jgi:NitT/TauT family transport system substrate-binding protein
VPAYTLLVSERLASKIRQPHDLVGHNIGVHTASKSGRSTGQQMTEYILLKAGVEPGQVNFVSTGQNFEAYKAALMSGAIDALIANEPSASHLEDLHIAFRLVDLHDPATSHKYMGDLFLYTQLCTRADTVRQQPEKIKRMVTALRRSLQWISLNAAQDISAALWSKDSPERAELNRVLSKQKRMFSPDAQFSDRQIHAVETFLASIEPGQRAAGWLEGFIDDRWAGRKP